MKPKKKAPAVEREISLIPFGSLMILEFKGYTDKEAAALARLSIPAINQAWKDNASKIRAAIRKG